MKKTIPLCPDDNGELVAGISNKKENKHTKIKFDERAFLNAYIKKFYSIGYLTSAETGEILGTIGGGNAGQQSA